MNMKKISAACATAAALAALCVPGSAFAADGTLTLNAGDGSTLAGHSFTVYKVAGYNDVVKDGANVKSVSASSPDATTDAWVKAALNKNGVTYNTSEGRNAAEQLLRLKTDSNTLRKVAGTLQSTAASSKVAAVKTNQTSTTGSLNLTLPEGYYLVVDAQGIPILVSTTIGGSVRMSNGQTLGSTQIKTNVTKIDKKIKSVDGTWKDSAAATNGETRDFKATFTVPNKLAVDTITLEDHMTGITYIDGSFHATTSSGTDVTNQFGTIGKDKITAAAGNTQTDGTGFKVTSLQSLVDTYQGKQVTVTYQGKVVKRVQGQQGHQPDHPHVELAAVRHPAGRADPEPGHRRNPGPDLRRESEEDQRGRRQQGHPGSQVQAPQRQPEPVVRVEHELEPVDVHHG